MTEKVTPENIHAYLRQHQEKELCRFVTVGSVDDGKSTLIGRLLHDTHGIYEDQLDAVKKATKQEGAEIDFSLFTDGLKAEREQGITIDVAYRYFSTENRKFIIADTPGHVQYTRNMATGASTATVAIILIDARLGVLQQSRRHAYISSLLGIPHLAVCVNKMDLVDFDQGVFDKIQAEFSEFCSQLRFNEVKFIPISAMLGDNVVHSSEKTASWYDGGTILEYLEGVPVEAGINKTDFRFPVQYVLRPNLNYRGFSGTIASGKVKKGDTLMSLPSGKKSKVIAIDTYDGEFEEARAPMAVTIRFADEIDTSRGDMLVHEDNKPLEVQRFAAKVVWMSEEALDRGRSYMIKHTSQLVRADVEDVEFLVDLETLEQKPANRIELNDIGQIIIHAHKTLFVDPYAKNAATGAFIIIDPISNNTVAAGMVEGLVDAGTKGEHKDVELPRTQITSEQRRDAIGQSGVSILVTGLPAAGKSEIAFELEKQLFDMKKIALVVDPDDGIGRSAPTDGSSPTQTPEFAKRTADVGLISIFTFAMPLRADRAALRDAVGRERFVEVFASASLDTCKERDERGLYDPNHPAPTYERPQEADIELDLSKVSVKDAAQMVIAKLKERGLV